MKSIVMFFLAGLLLLACDRKPAGKPVQGAKADTVNVFSLTNTSIEKRISLPGELLPHERVEIRPKVTGYIRELKVDIGSVVRKGQTLLIIDAPEIESQLGEAFGKRQAAKAKYQSSLDTYNRILKASKTAGVISESELERVRNEMSSDSAAYQAAKFSSASFQQVGNYLAIAAPFNGIVTQRNVNTGAYVGNGNEKPVIVIEDNSTLRLRVAVPEALTGVSLKNNKATFTTKANPTQIFTATLARKSGSIDPNTRTEVWEFEVGNHDNAVKSGSFANVDFVVFRDQPSFAVPYSAIVTSLERKFVIKISRDSTRWVDVSQGLNLSDKAEVFGNLHAGDTLVTKGSEELKPAVAVVTRFEKKH